jgi:hypothetical protein
MAPNVKKALNAFIDNIPDDKLTGFPSQSKSIHKDDNFRLDMQGVCVFFVVVSQHGFKLLMVFQLISVPGLLGTSQQPCS